MKYANLHLHSIYSDGVYTPRELCERAKAMGYGAVALTDHETAAGYAALAEATSELGLEHILGAEFTANGFGECFHIVALDFDPTEKAIAEHIEILRRNAYNKTKAKFEALRGSDFLRGLTWREVEEDAPAGAWFCNEQIFASLAKRKEFRQERFWDYFFKYKAMRVTFEEIEADCSVERIISLIRSAGGIAVLAHPHDQLRFLPELCGLGLSGVECDHPELTENEKKQARTLAKELGLYISGGTDHFGRLGDYPDVRGDFPGAAELAGEDFYCPITYDAHNGITKEVFGAIKNRTR